MSTISLKIKGLDRLQKKFTRMPGQFNRELNNAIKKSIFLIEAKTKPEVPVDTGLLRGSIGSGLGGFKKFKNLYGAIGTRIAYAIYVSEGTYKMMARPFMKKGTEKAKSQIERYFKKAIEKVLRI